MYKDHPNTTFKPMEKSKHYSRALKRYLQILLGRGGLKSFGYRCSTSILSHILFNNLLSELHQGKAGALYATCC